MSITPAENALSRVGDVELKSTFTHLNKINSMMARNPGMFDLQAVEALGRGIYKIQEYKDLATVMEHPEFYHFYKTYATQWSKFKDMLIMMNIYDNITKILRQIDPNEEKYNAYHKLCILYNLINNQSFRHKLLKIQSRM